MKPLDWIILIVGIFYLFQFIIGFIATDEILFKTHADKVWAILGKRFLKGLLCFGFILWRIYG